VPTEHVDLPVVLLTVVLDDLHGTAAPLAPVMVQVAVPVGSPAPGEAAATVAEKLAALAVIVGLSLAATVTWEGDVPTVWLKVGEADDPKLGDPE